MMSKYQIGYNFEKLVWKEVDLLLNLGAENDEFRFKITRSAGSKGTADLVVGITFPDAQHWFGIQCKKTKPAPKAMQKEIKRVWNKEGMIMFYAYRLDGRVQFTPDLVAYIRSLCNETIT